MTTQAQAMAEVRKDLNALSKRLKKVKQHAWIIRHYGVASTVLTKFASMPPENTSLKTYYLINAAVTALEEHRINE